MSLTLVEINAKTKIPSAQYFTLTDSLMFQLAPRCEHEINLMRQTFLNEFIRGKTVLDIGSNYGLYSFYCEDFGALKVVGIDPSEICYNIAVSINKLRGEKYIQFRNEVFNPQMSESFDIILCCSVYHYLYMCNPNHDFLFSSFARIASNIFWESPVDIVEGHINCNKENYTEEKILASMQKYFDTTHIGCHKDVYRPVYWLKRKGS